MADDIFYRLLFIGLYGLFFVVRGYYRFVKPKREEPEVEEQEKRGLGIIGIAMSITILSYFASIVLYLIGFPLMDIFQYDTYSLYLRWIGVIIVLIMIPLLAWIHRSLDRQYSACLRIKSGHHLITGGPYAKVRHPMYTVLGFFALGMSLVTANILMIVFSVFIMAEFPFIVRQEEEMLIETFGEEYLEYMKRTHRFFPV